MSVVIESIAIGSAIFSAIHFIGNVIKTYRDTKKSSTRHHAILDILQPKDNPTPESTPHDANPYEQVNESDFVEMKRFYNKKTGKAEYLYQAPETARGEPPVVLPKLNLKNKH